MDIVLKVIEGVGEVGRDTTVELSANYYTKLYHYDFDGCGYETLEEALEELEYAVREVRVSWSH